MFHSVDEIKSQGFVGFKKVSELYDDSSCIPKCAGVYLVIYSDKILPVFIPKGTSGKYKRELNLSCEELKNNWVSTSPVLYIGKASLTKNTSLRKRIRDYVLFGYGKPVAHRGGRFIWQLENSKNLIVCWKEVVGDNPRELEKELILNFSNKHTKKPFANMNK